MWSLQITIRHLGSSTPVPRFLRPFAQDTEYFGNAQQQWMIDFRVANLDTMAALKNVGVFVELNLQAYPTGRFARIHDPEDNPIELWEPVGCDVPRS